MNQQTDGYVAAGFEPVASAFAAAQAADPGGAQLCVYRHGVPVVDVWAGADAAHDRPWTGDTLTVVMSCTKGAVAVLAHRLIERGELDLEAPVADYWPEFAQGGKAGVRVSHLLTHSAGLAGFDPEAGIGAAGVLDWQRCVAALAAMEPLWPAGTAHLYHFITWGFLVGELIARAGGRPVNELFADEIARPLALDFWIGLPEAEEPRVAPHFRSSARLTREGLDGTFRAAGIDTSTRLVRVMVEAMVTTEALIDLMTERAGRAAVVPAGNGVASARALARLYAACVGEVDGVRLLSPATVERARRPHTDHLDGPPPFLVRGGAPQRFGLGFELPRPTLPMLGAGSFGHPGAGGRLAFAHPEKGLAVGYACSNLVWDGQNPDPRWGFMAALNAVVDRGT
jgi:CubicO group peptidase (beta-lactamase class C family)